MVAAVKGEGELKGMGMGHAEESDGRPIWAITNADILKAAK